MLMLRTSWLASWRAGFLVFLVPEGASITAPKVFSTFRWSSGPISLLTSLTEPTPPSSQKPSPTTPNIELDVLQGATSLAEIHSHWDAALTLQSVHSYGPSGPSDAYDALGFSNGENEEPPYKVFCHGTLVHEHIDGRQAKAWYRTLSRPDQVGLVLLPVDEPWRNPVTWLEQEDEIFGKDTCRRCRALAAIPVSHDSEETDEEDGPTVLGSSGQMGPPPGPPPASKPSQQPPSQPAAGPSGPVSSASSYRQAKKRRTGQLAIAAGPSFQPKSVAVGTTTRGGRTIRRPRLYGE